MRRILTSILLIFIITTIISAQDVKKYGKDLTLTEKTKISDIIANPESFVGQKVLVEGTVINVCEMRGCWIELSSDKEFETIRVKVNDGEIVFPMESKGKKALVEGEVYSFVIDSKEACSGNCKDKKEGEDHKCEKEKSKKAYQIKGIGAKIG